MNDVQAHIYHSLPEGHLGSASLRLLSGSEALLNLLLI